MVRQCILTWPRGLMDKASDFESEDCEFESRRGQNVLLQIWQLVTRGIHSLVESHTARIPCAVLTLARGCWLAGAK